MRVLIIKTSSLGDIIHTLPALSDAQHYLPDIHFDWVVESAFAEIPHFHPAVKKIIPVSLRRWRKNIFKALKSGEWQSFYKDLRQEKYDLIIDAQGLIKSGFLTFLAQSDLKCGYDRQSIWETPACLAYHQKYAVSPHQHAITRIRQLFAKSLNYPVPESETLPEYNIQLPDLNTDKKNYIMLLHGTTREDKCWPEKHWIKLIELLTPSQINILIPFGNIEEQNRAERLSTVSHLVKVLPKSSLSELAVLLRDSAFNVAVDSGLGHLSAALNTPTVSLYGPTDPVLIGTRGLNQIHIKESTMENIMPEKVSDLFKRIAEFPL